MRVLLSNLGYDVNLRNGQPKLSTYLPPYISISKSTRTCAFHRNHAGDHPLLLNIDALPPPDATRREEELEQQLQANISSTPLILFRCPLSDDATLRVRLPRRYPGTPLVASVEGTPQLSAATRAQILSAVQNEARRLSGERRNEPHCLSVLSEAMLAASDPGRLEDESGRGTSLWRSAEENDPAGDKAIGGTTSSSTVDPTRMLDTEHAGYGRWEGGIGVKAGSGHQEDGEGMRHAQRVVEGDGEASLSLLREKEAKAVYLGKRLIYSHHIIAPQKRAGILKTARELELGGFSKVLSLQHAQ